MTLEAIQSAFAGDDANLAYFRTLVAGSPADGPAPQVPTFLTAFFFSDGDAHGNGVEFTHKSIAEYLYARRLLRTAKAAIVSPPTEANAWLSETWGGLTGAEPMTFDILDLLRGELKRSMAAGDWPAPAAWRGGLRPLLEAAMANGVGTM
ncbi:MAG: hypothetical protein RIM80_28435, partial [Alphaproteobacteria bacterium]